MDGYIFWIFFNLACVSPFLRLLNAIFILGLLLTDHLDYRMAKFVASFSRGGGGGHLAC